MTSELPVPIEVPLQLPVSHRSVVPEPPEAVRVIFEYNPAQKLFWLLDADVGATGDPHAWLTVRILVPIIIVPFLEDREFDGIVTVTIYPFCE